MLKTLRIGQTVEIVLHLAPTIGTLQLIGIVPYFMRNGNMLAIRDLVSPIMFCYTHFLVTTLH